MEPIYLVLALGLIGGLLSAFYRIKWPSHSSDLSAAEANGRRPIEPPTINSANIHVQGVGGLGLVAACVGIAIAIPEIGLRMLVAVPLGALLATALVLIRRRRPLPWNGNGPAARSTFRFDETAERKEEKSEPWSALLAPAQP